MERAMGIEQIQSIQSAKTRRYCPLFSSIGVKWSQKTNRAFNAFTKFPLSFTEAVPGAFSGASRPKAVS
jgi:hypothetical protein